MHTDIGSLTGVERACDESEQVLCESENFTLAPFPAAHLYSLGRGTPERCRCSKQGLKVLKMKNPGGGDLVWWSATERGRCCQVSSTLLAVSASPSWRDAHQWVDGLSCSMGGRRAIFCQVINLCFPAISDKLIFLWLFSHLHSHLLVTFPATPQSKHFFSPYSSELLETTPLDLSLSCLSQTNTPTLL